MKPILSILLLLVASTGSSMPMDRIVGKIDRIMITGCDSYAQSKKITARLYPNNHYALEGKRLQEAFLSNPSPENIESLSAFVQLLKSKLP